jgi:putative oxygen-independent coproporphyrinogen III oxidase
MQKDNLGVYIHWPFCLSKCPYCDFNSHVRKNLDVDTYDAALCAHLEHAITQIAMPRPVSSIFFGGGTPSLMPPALVAKLINIIDKRLGVQHKAEITLEANPTSAERQKFINFRAAGINRLSLGVQALSDRALTTLGRTYTTKEALQAAQWARCLFSRVSFDIIYARQYYKGISQNNTWQHELDEVLLLADDHLSLYQLTIEDGTRFADYYKTGKLKMPSDDDAANLYTFTNTYLQQKGFTQYETSNYCRAGGESRHNLLYWQYQEYIGVGAGACGRYYRHDGAWVATQSIKNPESWAQAALTSPTPDEVTPLTLTQQGTEFLLMQARLGQGIDLTAWQKLMGDALKVPELLHEQNLVQHIGNYLVLSPEARALSNTIVAMLAAENNV